MEVGESGCTGDGGCGSRVHGVGVHMTDLWDAVATDSGQSNILHACEGVILTQETFAEGHPTPWDGLTSQTSVSAANKCICDARALINA